MRPAPLTLAVLLSWACSQANPPPKRELPAPRPGLTHDGGGSIASSESQALPIGWALPHVLEPKASSTLKTAAMEQHRAGHYAEASVGFRAALALAESDDMARYNLACSPARAGDSDGAFVELTQVVSADPGRFAGRLCADPDLATLRSQARWKGLELQLRRALQLWRAGLQQGVPAVLVPETTSYLHERADQLPEFFVPVGRVGVYLSEPKRFLPVGEPLSHFIAAGFSTVSGQGLTLFGTGLVDVPGALYPARLAVWPLAATDGKPANTVFDYGVRAIDMDLGRIEAGAIQRYGDGRSPPRMLASEAGPILRVMPTGSLLLVGPLASVSLQGAVLSVAGHRTKLAGEHARADHVSVLKLPHGLLVLSTRATCQMVDVDRLNSRSVLSHVVDYVRDGEVLRVSAGEGAATALLVGQRVFLQLAQTTSVLNAALPVLAEGDVLPPGVLLHVPLLPQACTQLM